MNGEFDHGKAQCDSICEKTGSCEESGEKYKCDLNGTEYDTESKCESACHVSEECIKGCPAPELRLTGDEGEERCEAAPGCYRGSFDPELKICREKICPYGIRYDCRQYNGEDVCAKNRCVNSDMRQAELGTEEGFQDQADNGAIEQNQSCNGEVYIFSGKDRRCRNWGVRTAFDNCCREKDYLFGLMDCKPEELQLADIRDAGSCHKVGNYCSRDIDLLFGSICIERKNTYCCFGTKLARIIHEQGRPQLKTFQAGREWGSAKHPNCRGLKPQEFKMLDFSKMDMSEYVQDLKINAEAEVDKNAENIKQGIRNYYDNI